jgi:hypothetical protein
VPRTDIDAPISPAIRKATGGLAHHSASSNPERGIKCLIGERTP